MSMSSTELGAIFTELRLNVLFAALSLRFFHGLLTKSIYMCRALFFYNLWLKFVTVIGVTLMNQLRDFR